MKKAISIILAFLFIPIFLCADGVQPSGSGTEADPWQIATLDNLLWVSTNDTSWGDHFIQTADIDASDTQNWNGGEGWSPIGNYDTPFEGQYNGQKRTIDGLYLYRPSSTYQGLFGYTSDSVLTNVYVTNANITGSLRVGCLLGRGNNDQISWCYSTGSVTGSGKTGGLIGNAFTSNVENSYSQATVSCSGNDSGGLTGDGYHTTFYDCYSLGSVSGYSAVGGLLGWSDGSSVIRCFSYGHVSGSNRGGLIGRDYGNGSCSNSFWDTEASGQSTSTGGTGKTTAEMQDIATYTNLANVGLDAPWDFVGDPNDDTGSEDIWNIDGVTNGGYPFLSWQATITLQDSLALVAFYESTGGDNWVNNEGWLTDAPLDDWYGVTVSGGRVTWLYMSSNRLTGTLPACIGDLTGLTHLNVGSISPFEENASQMTGEIPPEIGNLSNLSYLNLSCNHLSGEIPPELGNLTELSSLYLNNNDLTGGIPSTFESMVNLTFFHVGYNNLTGTLTGLIDLLSGASNLLTLAIEANHFTGEVPPGLGAITSLQSLSLGMNQLTGDLSTIVSYFDGSEELELLDLGGNQITGPIPTSIGNFPNLNVLGLYSMPLSGTIPAEIGNLSNLYVMILHDAQLSGTIPLEIGNLTNLQIIYLQENSFSGAIPESFGNLTQMNRLMLHDNRFDALPDCSAMTILDSLSVFGNLLTFEDIEPNLDIASSFRYSPQDSVLTAASYELEMGQSITMRATVGGEHNTYQWYRGEGSLANASDSILVLDNLQEYDSGVYTCRINNTLATDLTLYRRPITITVTNPFFAQDSLALVAFYESTGGDNWVNNDGWLTDAPLDDWYGVTVSGGRVTGLSLYQNALSGTLPPEIGDLTGLTSLSLHSSYSNPIEEMNQITGEIPSEIGQMTELTTLRLNYNQFEGEIPGTFSNLVNLQTIDIANNEFSGTISDLLGYCQSMESIQTIDIASNNFTGEIPAILSNLQSLRYIDSGGNNLTGNLPSIVSYLIGIEELYSLNLGSNQISGVIPSEIGSLTSLTYLGLSSNQLTGTIPPEIGNLENLSSIYLSYNDLTGTILPEIGNLTSLTRLYLNNNEFTGTIPPEIGNLTSLTYLNLGSNDLTGSIPPEIGNLTSLTYLNLGSNDLTGSIPPEIGNLTSLTTLSLNSNQLTGSIQPEIGNLTSLTQLYLYNNEFTGTIPPEIGNLTSLRYLYLYDNQLTGTIPPEIGNLTSLQYLYLYDNALTGSIPLEIGNLTSLQYLYLYDNALTGSIPPEIGNLSSLTYLWLNNNQLTGTISPEIGNLTSLTSLSLYSNQLIGSIPPEIGNLTSLKHLYLYSNQLTGAIPSELGQLSDLTWLRLDDNQLSGSIPTELDQLTNLEYLYLQSNQLAGPIPEGFINLTKMDWMFLQDNKFTDLPTLTSMDTLRILNVTSNHFTFEDIEPNLGVASEWFYYSPQDSVLTKETVRILEDLDYTLSSTVGGENNVYQWYKDGAIMDTETDSVLALTNLQEVDNGVYTCRITNTLATQLTLHRRPITLEVLPTNDAPVITLPDSLHMHQNEVTTIDFSGWVSDEDGDSLALSVEGNVHIGIEVNGLQIGFICSDNWVGQEELTFIVDDGVIEQRVQAYTRSRRQRNATRERTTASDDCIIDVFTPLEFEFHTDSGELNNNVVAGDEELALTFTAVSYADPITSWQWDFNDDGTVDSEEGNPVWTYMDEGYQTVSVTVSDGVHVNWLTKEDFILVHPGQTVPGGDVETDIVWTEAEGPYNITGEVLLNEAITLTIEENTQVNLLMDSPLVVNGSLVATDADFTAYGAAGWEGLVFSPASDGNVIDGLNVVGASTAIVINDAAPTLRNVVITGDPDRGGRPATPAIVINGNSAPELQDIRISGYAVGIRGVNTGDELSTMQFSDIHLERRIDSPGLEDTGLQFNGAFDIEIDSLLIEGYPNGGTFEDPAATGLPRTRMTNTRVRHTENSARDPHTGLSFINIADIELEADSLGNFQKGIVIDNSGLSELGQVEIHHIDIIHDSYGQAEYGVHLTGPCDGHLTDGYFENYPIAIYVTGNNEFFVLNTEYHNCGNCMTLDNNTDNCAGAKCTATRDEQFAGDIDIPAIDVISGSANTFANWTLYDYDCGIRTTSNHTFLYQCIFWGDQAMANPVDIVSGNGPNVHYCDINWDGGVWEGEGNINVDPLFVAVDSTDFYLDVYSPCIDAGHPEYPADPDGSIPDMGAVWFDQDNMPLYADFYWDVDSGLAPLTVQFTDHATFNTTSWQWDFDGDGETDATEPSPQWTYENIGIYDVSLTVSDGERDTTITMVDLITVNNAAPHIVQPFPDLALDEDFTPFHILLSDYIADANGDQLSYSAGYSEDEITLEISGDTLWVQSVPDWSGVTSITITADDGRMLQRTRKQYARKQPRLRDQVSDDFQIEIHSVNDAPYLIAPLPDTTGVQNFETPIEYVMTDYFGDIDNDALLFTVEYQPDEINAQIDGNTLILTAVPDWFGTTQLVVTADDEEPTTRKHGSRKHIDNVYRATCNDTFLVVLDEVSIDPDETVSWNTRLYPAYPNPVRGETCISFSLKEPSNVDVAIYNIRGQRVATLASERFGKGMHRLRWNCRDRNDRPVATGVYLLRMQSRDAVEMQKVMYIK